MPYAEQGLPSLINLNDTKEFPCRFISLHTQKSYFIGITPTIPPRTAD